MKFGNLMVIDPSLEVPEIESYNEISLYSPLKGAKRPTLRDFWFSSAKELKLKDNNI